MESSGEYIRGIKYVGAQVVPVTFAVFINLLDACTFGVCFFPSQLGETSSLAIELFLLSTVVVQIALIMMSSFNSALGTSMAENIPFIHAIALGVINSMPNQSPQEQLPTVLVAVAISTVFNGLIFYLFGFLRLGHILHFFPRHIILGMTGGFGFFLAQTAFEVCTGIVVSELASPAALLPLLSTSRLVQLAVIGVYEYFLRTVEHRKLGGDLAVPLLMFALPLSFYLALLVTDSSFEEARAAGWLFPEPPATHWWDTWTPFFAAPVDWNALGLQSWTILSLALFTLILVPIRIPSLSLITGEEADFDSELKAQGMGNILAGLLGTPHNYLSYANSILYFNTGGTGKLSQFAVASLSLMLFVIGPTLLNFVPRILAGVIMLHLGVDLMHNAVVASRETLDLLEYVSVLFVGAVVSVLGFVPGIAAGGMVACVTFVVQASQVGRLRAKLEAAMAERKIVVVQLQGHIFFGNIQQVVKGVTNIITGEIVKSNAPSNYSSQKTQLSQSGSKTNMSLLEAQEHLSSVAKQLPLLSTLVGNATRLGYKRQRDSLSMKMVADGDLERGLSLSASRGRGLSRANSESSLADLARGAGSRRGSFANISELSEKTAAVKCLHHYLILDCSFVTGMDGNAIAGLIKLKNRLYHDTTNAVEVEFAGLQSKTRAMFEVMERSVNTTSTQNQQQQPHAGASQSTSAIADYSSERTPLLNGPLQSPGRPGLSAVTEVAADEEAPDTMLSGSHQKSPKLKILHPPTVSLARPHHRPHNKAGTKKHLARIDEIDGSDKATNGPYYSDVNIALQYVEESILDAVKSPESSFIVKRGGLNSNNNNKMELSTLSNDTSQFTVEGLETPVPSQSILIRRDSDGTLRSFSSSGPGDRDRVNSGFRMVNEPEMRLDAFQSRSWSERNEYNPEVNDLAWGQAWQREWMLSFNSYSSGEHTPVHHLARSPDNGATDALLAESVRILESKNSDSPVYTDRKPFSDAAFGDTLSISEAMERAARAATTTLNPVRAAELHNSGTSTIILGLKDGQKSEFFQQEGNVLRKSYMSDKTTSDEMEQDQDNLRLVEDVDDIFAHTLQHPHSELRPESSQASTGIALRRVEALGLVMVEDAVANEKTGNLSLLAIEIAKSQGSGSGEENISNYNNNDNESSYRTNDQYISGEVHEYPVLPDQTSSERGFFKALVMSPSSRNSSFNSTYSMQSSQSLGSNLTGAQDPTSPRTQTESPFKHLVDAEDVSLAASHVSSVAMPGASIPSMTSFQSQSSSHSIHSESSASRDRMEKQESSDTQRSQRSNDSDGFHSARESGGSTRHHSKQVPGDLRGLVGVGGNSVDSLDSAGSNKVGGTPRLGREGSEDRDLSQARQSHESGQFKKDLMLSRQLSPFSNPNVYPGVSSPLASGKSIPPLPSSPSTTSHPGGTSLNSARRSSRRLSGRSGSPSALSSFMEPLLQNDIPTGNPAVEAAHREQKHLIRRMLLDLNSKWTRHDEPALKRLSKYLLGGVTDVKRGQLLWKAGDSAQQMGLLLKGKLKAVISANKYGSRFNVLQADRVLQVVLPGCFVGELGMLSKGSHSRTIVADEDSLVAILTRERIDFIEDDDKEVFCVLQSLALKTSASRSHELMLFNAGSLGP